MIPSFLFASELNLDRLLQSWCMRTMGQRTSRSSTTTPTEAAKSQPKSRPWMPPIFKYQPLDPSVDSFRLLILEPPKIIKSSEIRCRLVHTTFSQKPAYIALSYTWGSPDEVREIVGCVPKSRKS